jgi:hypothetical protein
MNSGDGKGELPTFLPQQARQRATHIAVPDDREFQGSIVT